MCRTYVLTVKNQENSQVRISIAQLAFMHFQNLHSFCLFQQTGLFTFMTIKSSNGCVIFTKCTSPSERRRRAAAATKRRLKKQEIQVWKTIAEKMGHFLGSTNVVHVLSTDHQLPDSSFVINDSLKRIANEESSSERGPTAKRIRVMSNEKRHVFDEAINHLCDKNPKFRCSAGALFEAYTAYHFKSDTPKALQLSSTEFYKCCIETFTKVTHSGSAKYVGIQLKDSSKLLD